jgi:putative tryptophan/tyrosine transport system substrate-binding protein
MRRRDFITLAGGAAAIWPLALNAQQTKVPTIGVLVVANPEPFLSLFREGLRERGYVVGQNLQLEFRSADGKPNLLAEHAAEFVRLKVDIIVASQTPAVQAAAQATKEIPIVMATAGDPVGTGLIASLARPGGNITGMSGTTAELGGKTLELIKEVLPPARRVAVLANATDPFTKSFLSQLELAARTVPIELDIFMVKETKEFAAAFAEMARRRADAVIVQPSLERKPATELSLQYRLPAFSPNRAFPEAGGLMSYAARFADSFRDAAVYVDKILNGSKPADLPVQQPTRFELSINLKTAKALGLDIPPMLLARADDVIE